LVLHVAPSKDRVTRLTGPTPLTARRTEAPSRSPSGMFTGAPVYETFLVVEAG